MLIWPMNEPPWMPTTYCPLGLRGVRVHTAMPSYSVFSAFSPVSRKKSGLPSVKNGICALVPLKLKGRLKVFVTKLMTRSPATTARWKIVGGGPLYKLSSTGGVASAEDTASAFAVTRADVAWETVLGPGSTTKEVVAAGFAVAAADETASWSSRRVAPNTDRATATTFGALGAGMTAVGRAGFETADTACKLALATALCRALEAEPAEVLLADEDEDDGPGEADPVSAHATP